MPYIPAGFSGQDYFYPSADAGTLTISGIPMNTWGWNVLELRDLLAVAAVRGQDRLIPGVSGMRPYRRRRTATPHSLPMIISGLHAIDGTPVTDNQERINQIKDHLKYLMDNVVAPVPTMEGTRSAVLTLPNTSGPDDVRTADIHVLGITPGQWYPVLLKCTLDISIPGGMFT